MIDQNLGNQMDGLIDVSKWNGKSITTHFDDKKANSWGFSNKQSKKFTGYILSIIQNRLKCIYLGDHGDPHGVMIYQYKNDYTFIMTKRMNPLDLIENTVANTIVEQIHDTLFAYKPDVYYVELINQYVSFDNISLEIRTSSKLNILLPRLVEMREIITSKLLASDSYIVQAEENLWFAGMKYAHMELYIAILKPKLDLLTVMDEINQFKKRLHCSQLI